MPRNNINSENITKNYLKDSYEEFGVSGLEQWAGIIHEEWLNELSDLYKSNKIYKQMRDNEPILGAFLYVADMYIRKVNWFAKPGGISNKALQKAEFLDSCMKDFKNQNWNDIISEILSMLPFGWSAAEKVYRIRKNNPNDPHSSKFNDGKIGWSRFGFRAQETLYSWKYEENELKGMIQTDPLTYKQIFIPIEKLLLFRTKIYKDNPQGVSVFRSAFRPWWFKTHLEEFEAIGLEHSAVGVPIGWVPKDILTDKTKTVIKKNFADAITKIQTGKGGAIILPLEYDQNNNKKFDITLLQGNSKSSEIAQIGTVIERYDTRIAQSVLYDIVMVGTKSTGSYALAENKSTTFVLALTTYLRIIQNILNENAVNELFRLNGDDMQELPTIEFTPIVKADLNEVGNYLKNLSTSGLLAPNRALIKFVMQIANLPEPDNDEIESMMNGNNIIKNIIDEEEDEDDNNENDNKNSDNADNEDENDNTKNKKVDDENE